MTSSVSLLSPEGLAPGLCWGWPTSVKEIRLLSRGWPWGWGQLPLLRGSTLLLPHLFSGAVKAGSYSGNSWDVTWVCIEPLHCISHWWPCVLRKQNKTILCLVNRMYIPRMRTVELTETNIHVHVPILTHLASKNKMIFSNLIWHRMKNLIWFNFSLSLFYTQFFSSPSNFLEFVREFWALD